MDIIAYWLTCYPYSKYWHCDSLAVIVPVHHSLSIHLSTTEVFINSEIDQYFCIDAPLSLFAKDIGSIVIVYYQNVIISSIRLHTVIPCFVLISLYTTVNSLVRSPIIVSNHICNNNVLNNYHQYGHLLYSKGKLIVRFHFNAMPTHAYKEGRERSIIIHFNLLSATPSIVRSGSQRLIETTHWNTQNDRIVVNNKMKTWRKKQY